MASAREPNDEDVCARMRQRAKRWMFDGFRMLSGNGHAKLALVFATVVLLPECVRAQTKKAVEDKASNSAAQRQEAGTIVTLLRNGHILLINALDGKALSEYTSQTSAVTPAFGGPFITLGRTGTTLFVLVQHGGNESAEVVAIDVASLTFRKFARAPGGVQYGSISVGARTDRIFLGSATSDRIVAINGNGEKTPQVWETHLDRSFDWLAYRGVVSADEQRFYFSYHGGLSRNVLTGEEGAPTGGVDWFDIHGDVAKRCGEPTRARNGCLGGHGRFELLATGLLVATGSKMVLDIDMDGRSRRSYDTMREEHLMDFATDAERHLLFAVGTCINGGGFTATALARDDMRTGAAPAARTGKPGSVSSSDAEVCGDRIVAGKSKEWVAVARAGQSGGEILVVDARTGSRRRTIATSSGVADLYVLP